MQRPEGASLNFRSVEDEKNYNKKAAKEMARLREEWRKKDAK